MAEGKTLTLTNREAEQFLTHPGLKKFMERETEIKFKNAKWTWSKLKYRVVKIKKKLEAEIQSFVEMRDQIAQKYAKKTPDGQVTRSPNGQPVIDPLKIDLVQTELKPLTEELIVLPEGYERITIDLESEDLPLTGIEIDMLLMVM